MKPTPYRDEWADELEHAGDDATLDVAEALDEAREVVESGGVEPWQETACPVCRPSAARYRRDTASAGATSKGRGWVRARRAGVVARPAAVS